MNNNISNQIISAIAPARVCLFGDHQDYLGLPIIAAAIDRYITIEGFTNNKAYFEFSLPDIDLELKIKLYEDEHLKNEGSFLYSAITVLRKHSYIIDRGFKVNISGNIPINSGLSSSSALMVAWIKFLVIAFSEDKNISEEDIAKLAYESEVVEMKTSGGKMDQYTSALGDIIYLETDSVSAFRKIKAPKMSIIVGESGIPKATLKVLKNIKNSCYEAIDHLKQHKVDFDISKVRPGDLPSLHRYVPSHLQKYLDAAVKNHDITLRAFKELEQAEADLSYLGNLMDEHHIVLRDYLDLTVPKIDSMIVYAKESGALGAKIVGSGKGGCIIALCKKDDENDIIDSIKNAGAKDAYSVNVSNGVRALKQ